MRLVPIACPSCGAKLRAPEAKTTVECEYCGTESFVQRRAGILERAVPIPDAVSIPVATQPHSRRFLSAAVLLPLILVGAPLGFAAYVALRVNWLGVSHIIVTDVDGDGDLDLVGAAQRGQGDAFVAAFDAKTGERLWSSDAIGEHADAVRGMVAVSGTTVLFLTDAAAITAFDGKTGETRWSSPALGERVEDVCTSEDGAVFLELGDDTRRRVALDSGAVGGATSEDCAPAWTDARPQPPQVELVEPTMLQAGTVEVDFVVRVPDGWLAAGAKAKGTRVPMVAKVDHVERTRLEDHHRLDARWEAPIPAMKPTESASHEAHVAVSDDQVFAAYALRDDSSRLTAFGLLDGVRRWDVEVDREAPLEAIAYADGIVYVALWGTLLAYDAADGRERFRIGY